MSGGLEQIVVRQEPATASLIVRVDSAQNFDITAAKWTELWRDNRVAEITRVSSPATGRWYRITSTYDPRTVKFEALRLWAVDVRKCLRGS